MNSSRLTRLYIFVLALACFGARSAHAEIGEIEGTDGITDTALRPMGNSIAHLDAISIFNNSWYIHDGSIGSNFHKLSAVGADGGSAPSIRLLGSTWKLWDVYGAAITARQNNLTNLAVQSRLAWMGTVVKQCSAAQSQPSLTCSSDFGSTKTFAAKQISFVIGPVPVSVGGSVFSNVNVSAQGRASVSPFNAVNSAAATDSANGGVLVSGNVTGTAFFAIGVRPVAAAGVTGSLHFMNGKYSCGALAIRARCAEGVGGCASNANRVRYTLQNEAGSDTGVKALGGKLTVWAELVSLELLKKDLFSWAGSTISVPSLYNRTRTEVFSAVL